jgi:hypothetical protein
MGASRFPGGRATGSSSARVNPPQPGITGGQAARGTTPSEPAVNGGLYVAFSLHRDFPSATISLAGLRRDSRSAQAEVRMIRRCPGCHVKLKPKPKLKQTSGRDARCPKCRAIVPPYPVALPHRPRSERKRWIVGIGVAVALLVVVAGWMTPRRTATPIAAAEVAAATQVVTPPPSRRKIHRFRRCPEASFRPAF